MDSSTQIIDLSYLKEMSGNNKDIMIEMVEIFIEQNPEFTEGISNHFKNKQWAQLGAIAHKAKSSVRIMGMSELGDCLEKIEHYSKGNKKIELQNKITDNHKLDDEDLKIWNNVQNEDINDINLEYIPELVSYFLTQSPKAISELEKALHEL
ncbi:HPt (histidine-containing phosphotransfer) domain-containing protein [Ancylomarina subtilis]|uniref:HPt (Histidine-containing phosphotransfer) domain-containing protein n=1 Tax=Ancylomarina subtilis TaxID=1639035 RepID=A0A4Q7VHA1_9BACT|nr:Hpt domain-containing protein [Ancylomarina subtilis]RZT95462.1 HPt (histidine-containing phosphotransfer) domain-containing protein [Ancylomarina subtilis]